MKCVVIGLQITQGDDWGYSPKIEGVIRSGHVVLVGIDIKKTKNIENDVVEYEDLHRTGELAYLKKEIAKKLFNEEPDEVIFVSDDVIKELKSITIQKN